MMARSWRRRMSVSRTAEVFLLIHPLCVLAQRAVDGRWTRARRSVQGRGHRGKGLGSRLTRDDHLEALNILDQHVLKVCIVVTAICELRGPFGGSGRVPDSTHC